MKELECKGRREDAVYDEGGSTLDVLTLDEERDWRNIEIQRVTWDLCMRMCSVHHIIVSFCFCC